MDCSFKGFELKFGVNTSKKARIVADYYGEQGYLLFRNIL